MYGYVAGYSETDMINYCPQCGEEKFEVFTDGTCKCEECGLRFGVVELED